MANTGNTQQQIDYGAAANDGTGDPLRTAFIKTDDNFDNIWLAGPVGSNITIINNTVQANDTNGNLILSPNGVGVIQTNSKLLPRLNNTYDLGSSALKYRAGYFGAGGLVIDGNVTVAGNLTAGNISYTGNVFVGDLQGSVYADDSTIMVDAVDNELFASRATISGNVSATYFTGNGSLLIGIVSSYGNANVVANLSALGSNPVSTTGNISGNYFIGNGRSLTGITSSYGNANVVANLAALGSNPVSTTGNISGNYFIGNGSQLTGLAATYGNANVANYLPTFSGNISAGNVSATGNISAGNVSATGNITAGNINSSTLNNTGNISVVASGNTWTFGSNGNLTLPSNTSSINYANGNPYGGGGSANTGNVTFTDQIVIGTGTNDGGGGLYLAPGNASIANSAVQYLRVRGGDYPTHIHLDTGNNQYFDQYFGADSRFVKLEANGNVVINADDSGANSASWTFGTDGNLTLPGNLIIAGNTSVFGTDAALIAPTDGLPLLAISSGANGAVSSLWVEDIGNVGTSNIAAVYVNPTPGSGNVRIAVGQNGNSGPNLWDFDAAGNLSIPGNINFSGDASAAPSLNDFFSVTSAANFAIVTDNANADHTWTFGANGNLTAPGNISVTGNITAGNVNTGKITLTNGAVIKDTTGLAIGYQAGYTGQRQNAVAIGVQAGYTGQGNNAVAIGTFAGGANQGNNSIILNATGDAVNQTTANTFTVAPVRNDVANTAEVMFYNTTSKEITYGNTISVAGNISGSNLNVTGNIVDTGALSIITGSNGNIALAPNGTGIVTASGNISAVGNITGGNISTGNVSTTGNVSAANFFGNGNTLSNVATTFESTWTVPTGNSTQSFTVTPNNTYYMWVDCNITNGILAWNATGTVTNTNVPVVGAQYAWVYSGGGTPIDFTSIPDQFVGTSNTIVRSSVSPSATTNRFDFGINNASGNTVTVNYGYARIS